MTLRRGFLADAEREAKRIRADLDLGPAEPVDVFQIAKHLGIRVIAADELIDAARLHDLERVQAFAFSACTFDIDGSKVVVVDPLRTRHAEPATSPTSCRTCCSPTGWTRSGSWPVSHFGPAGPIRKRKRRTWEEHCCCRARCCCPPFAAVSTSKRSPRSTTSRQRWHASGSTGPASAGRFAAPGNVATSVHDDRPILPATQRSLSCPARAWRLPVIRQVWSRDVKSF